MHLLSGSFLHATFITLISNFMAGSMHLYCTSKLSENSFAVHIPKHSSKGKRQILYYWQKRYAKHQTYKNYLPYHKRAGNFLPIFQAD